MLIVGTLKVLYPSRKAGCTRWYSDPDPGFLDKDIGEEKDPLYSHCVSYSTESSVYYECETCMRSKQQ